jgi:hypothetical protein
MLRSTLFLIGLLVSSCSYAWGPRGHEYSGAIADALLTPHAKAQIQKLLGYPLKTAATWADCVKDVKMSGGQLKYLSDPKYHQACVSFETPEGEAEMTDYVSRNWNNCSTDPKAKECHKEYHFADVAIQHNQYSREFVGTSDHDIVSAINAAIAVLQNQPTPAPFNIKDKREAVLMLAHLIGDLHQPLHVGAIYLDSQDHPVDPDSPPGSHDPATDTRGGNWIDVGSSNLHADWDNILKTLNPETVAPKVIAKAKALPQPTGPISSWAAHWAGDAVKQSQKAFQGISYAHPGTKGKWEASFEDRKSYSAAKRKAQQLQLEKAGAHLAAVLNEVLK